MSDLHGRIAEALAAYHRQHSTVCEHTQLVEHGAAADAVMAVVQPELIRLHNAWAEAKQGNDERLLNMVEANAQFVTRMEQAEAERDRLRAAAQEVAGLLFNALIHPEPTACMGRVPSVSSECGVCRARAVLEAALDQQEQSGTTSNEVEQGLPYCERHDAWHVATCEEWQAALDAREET